MVSPHKLASQAGLDIIAAGGNAVDAAIAVNAVMSVVAPDTCGPGGDLFALVHRPGMDIPMALNASGRAGSGVTADQMRDDGYGVIPSRGPWSVTVPGCVDGWEALSVRFGKLSLAEAVAPAVTIAKEGFAVSRELAQSLADVGALIGDQLSAGPMYRHGIPAGEGESVIRNDIAYTLEAIGSSGRQAFYVGEPGIGITEATLGAITEEDLSKQQADWVDPASINVFGRTAWTIGPNTQGYLTLATLWIFEQLDPPTDPEDPLFHHLLIEAYRSMAWERSMYVTDPQTAPHTSEQLLSPDRLAKRAAAISHTHAGRWPIPTRKPAGTAYMTVRDGSGMGVSLIQSNYAGIGSGLTAGDTGVFLHNRGAGFNLIQGHPGEYRPGRRPMHTLSPTIWTHNTSLSLLLGTRGGDQQPQFLAQFAALHRHARLSIAASQEFPRWNIAQPKPGADSAVHIEPRFGPATKPALESLGHRVDNAEPWEPDWGPISAIEIGETVNGAADPRISTSAALTG